jgi:hypothetical protein
MVARHMPHRYPCDRLMRAEVAQSVEHRPEEAGVVSSILTLGTSNAVSSGLQAGGSGSVGRASPCQGEGRGFESRLPLHFHVWLVRPAADLLA